MSVALKDFLTHAQIKAALTIWEYDRVNFHSRILDEIILPAMPEINRKLKQENVPGYIVYVIEYVFTELSK
jgi:hypothetical protein